MCFKKCMDSPFARVRLVWAGALLLIIPAFSTPTLTVDLSTTPADAGVANQPVTVQAQATGDNNLTYQFWVGDPTATYWMLLQDYAAASTITWTPTMAGTFPLVVRVRDVDSTAPFDAQNDLFYPVNAAPAPLTALAIATTPNAAGVVNQPVTVQAQATGGVNLRYQFWVGDPTATYWTLLQDYSTANTITWTPTATGTFPLVARVRASDSTALYDLQNYLFYPVNADTAPPMTGLTIATAPDDAGVVSQPVTITAQATGGSNPVFQFWLGDPTGTYWTLLRDYAPGNSITWTPTATGIFPLVVRVRSASSNAQYDLQNNLFFPVNPLSGNLSAGPVAISGFLDNKPAAISYTFDDGMQSAIDYGAAALDAFGYKGTFNVITGFTRILETDPQVPLPNNVELKGSWQGWAQVQANGHEIGNHTYDHPDMTTLTDPAQIDLEINGSAALIAANLGLPPFTFAYPYNDHTPYLDSLVLQHHYAIRLEMTQFGEGGLEKVKDMNATVDAAIEEGSWLVPQLHGFLPAEYGTLDPKLFSKHLSYVATLADQVWIDTYGHISRYVQERTSAVLEVDALASNQLTFALTCPLEATVFNQPLTVSIATGATQLTIATAITGNVSLPVTVLPDGNLLVNVVPGSGKIQVNWQ